MYLYVFLHLNPCVLGSAQQEYLKYFSRVPKCKTLHSSLNYMTLYRSVHVFLHLDL